MYPIKLTVKTIFICGDLTKICLIALLKLLHSVSILYGIFFQLQTLKYNYYTEFYALNFMYLGNCKQGKQLSYTMNLIIIVNVGIIILDLVRGITVTSTNFFLYFELWPNMT